jgi:hypothetical protein
MRVASVCACVGEARHVQLMSHRDRHCAQLGLSLVGFASLARQDLQWFRYAALALR